mmetsp:Transcript_66931/g.189219  ORF Transcript_66931/g.189219 Transcript_66931/m.189219 type:complete len:222 (-) Transcript_66931:663-1328(-)
MMPCASSWYSGFPLTLAELSDLLRPGRSHRKMSSPNRQQPRPSHRPCQGEIGDKDIDDPVGQSLSTYFCEGRVAACAEHLAATSGMSGGLLRTFDFSRNLLTVSRCLFARRGRGWRATMARTVDDDEEYKEEEALSLEKFWGAGSNSKMAMGLQEMSPISSGKLTSCRTESIQPPLATSAWKAFSSSPRRATARDTRACLFASVANTAPIVSSNAPVQSSS